MTLNRLQETLRTTHESLSLNLPILIDKIYLYLDKTVTQQVLLRPIHSKILNTLSIFSRITTQVYFEKGEDEDLQVIDTLIHDLRKETQLNVNASMRNN